MTWLAPLLHGSASTQTLLILSLVIAAGIALGNLRVFGVSFGVACVLFTGLLVGHIRPALDERVLLFVQELGLVLFVYTVGLQAGPGFLASFRRHGLGLSVAALGLIALNSLLMVGLRLLADVPLPVAAGLLTGAVTNTPSMAAAQQALQSRAIILPRAEELVGVGYALAYPFGVLGTILTMAVIRRVFRIDPQQEAAAYAAEHTQRAPAPENLNVEVNNPQLAGQPLASLAALIQPPVAISRLLRGDRVEVPKPATRLALGDVLHAVGPPESLAKLRLTVGDQATVDLRELPSRLTVRQVVVTQRDALGRSLAQLDLSSRYAVALTRVARSGTEFVPHPAVRLQFGDRVTVVGDGDAIRKVCVELGDSARELRQPQLLPLFLGLIGGIALGRLPLRLPGIPVPVQLGLAGGPLLMAMGLARIGRIGPAIWFMPQSAGWFLREFGIALFLAAVGIRSGDQLAPLLGQASGWWWLLGGALITLVPLLIVAALARGVWRMNYGSLCGLLAGSMTDPPALAYAHAVNPSEAPTVTYAAVYPVVICLRVLTIQALVLLLP